MKAATFVTGLILVSTLASGSAMAGTSNDCQRTAAHVKQSCQAEAKSNYKLALGKCDNIADATEQKDCKAQAEADFKDARQTCKEQFDARQAACERLSTAPYDPVINAANFVPKIDNPYFPLKPGTTFIYEGQTASGFEHDEFAVTHNTKVILGVTCIEVRDTVFTDGEMTEDTLDWFAQDNRLCQMSNFSLSFPTLMVKMVQDVAKREENWQYLVVIPHF